MYFFKVYVCDEIPMDMTNNLFRAREEKFLECWKFNKEENCLASMYFSWFRAKIHVFLTSHSYYSVRYYHHPQCYSISSMFFSVKHWGIQQHKTFISERKRKIFYYGSLSLRRKSCSKLQHKFYIQLIFLNNDSRLLTKVIYHRASSNRFQYTCSSPKRQRMKKIKRSEIALRHFLPRHLSVATVEMPMLFWSNHFYQKKEIEWMKMLRKKKKRPKKLRMCIALA